MMVETLITEKELCAWLRVSRSTVKKLRENDLPYFSIGSIVRYSKEDVQDWLAKHQHVFEAAKAATENLVEAESEDTEDREGQDDNSDAGPADHIREVNVEWHNQ